MCVAKAMKYRGALLARNTCGPDMFVRFMSGDEEEEEEEKSLPIAFPVAQQTKLMETTTDFLV